jgi:hypothetical protein
MTSSAVDSSNRKRDQLYVESMLGIPEFAPSTASSAVEFVSRADPSLALARGYVKVVYGDHGAFIELQRDHVVWASFPLHNEEKKLVAERFYDEHFTADKSVMLYEQRKTVGARPPNDGVGVVVKGRESYADYQPGRFYLSVKDVATARKDEQLQQQAGSAAAAASKAKQPRKSRLQ